MIVVGLDLGVVVGSSFRIDDVIIAVAEDGRGLQRFPFALL